jgi:hypothetical protein
MVPKRRKKRGRPRTGHDQMVGARLPAALIRKIDKVADVLACDRSTAIRWVIMDALTNGRSQWLISRSQRHRGWVGAIVSDFIVQFKASEVAKNATRRGSPIAKTQAEIRIHRAQEEAEDSRSKLIDKVARDESLKSRHNAPARGLSQSAVQAAVDRAIARSKRRTGQEGAP